jgi:hypothetical protein
MLPAKLAILPDFTSKNCDLTNRNGDLKNRNGGVMGYSGHLMGRMWLNFNHVTTMSREK